MFRKLSIVLAVALGSLAQAQLQGQTWITGLSLPVAMVQDPTDPSVFLIVQQRGRIRVVKNGILQTADFIDLTGKLSTGSEQGLLGIVLDPDYATNRTLYLNYTDTAGDTRVSKFLRNPIDPLKADLSSESLVIFIDQPFSNHNGGHLAFGPDGFLYIGMGDGGSGNDPGNRAQTITNQLLGKMLRIDPRSDDFPNDPLKNYSIPPTNPFVGKVGDDEIWSFGIRNPWRWSFDEPKFLGTGAMIIGDVGQNAFEEIDYEPPLASGRNYGWRVKEGFSDTGLGGGMPPYTDPIWDYGRSVGQTITGGYIYRGVKLGAEFFGRYFFADYIVGKVWTAPIVLDQNGEAQRVSSVLEHTQQLGGFARLGNVSSFAQDLEGELYTLNYGSGTIVRFLPLNRVWITDITTDVSARFIGGIRETVAEDAKALVLAPELSKPVAFPFSGKMTAGFQTDILNPATLDARFVVRTNQPTAFSLTVAFKNWNSGQFEIVGGPFTLTNVYQTFNLAGVPAGNYRRSDGRIEMQIVFRPTQPTFGKDNQLFIDQIRITAS